MPMHVDDAWGRGTPEFIKWLKYELEQEFQIGEFVCPKAGERYDFTGVSRYEERDSSGQLLGYSEDIGEYVRDKRNDSVNN